MKRYSVVYADPPWEMKSSSPIYRPKYPLMSYQDLLELPVNSISDDNCVLFMWSISGRLNEAIKIMEKWGFEYKTVAFCWVKTSKKTGMPNCRVGSYTLGGIELCLLGTKGKLKRKTLNIRQVLLEPRGVHSKKPDKIRDDITKLYGEVPRIELFARQKTKGWDVWGNEIESDTYLKLDDISKL